MKTPIAVYQFSLGRQIWTSAILLVGAVIFFAWWLDIKDPMIFLIPLGSLILFLSLHWIYAWSQQEKTAIKIYESGLYLGNEFVSWNEIEAVDLKKIDVDTISYFLIISKRDGRKLERSLDFLNEKSNVVFRSVRNAFETYS